MNNGQLDQFTARILPKRQGCRRHVVIACQHSESFRSLINGSVSAHEYVQHVIIDNWQARRNRMNIDVHPFEHSK
ncbi:uncharacterized protein METZ01_LOCUS64129 [marine metagenome]|uniref:Uncharacterized protein n=1 Tax=marine metagenome TaxID=408172 RepID=A0A381T532_9ZZZZ